MQGDPKIPQWGTTCGFILMKNVMDGWCHTLLAFFHNKIVAGGLKLLVSGHIKISENS